MVVVYGHAMHVDRADLIRRSDFEARHCLPWSSPNSLGMASQSMIDFDDEESIHSIEVVAAASDSDTGDDVVSLRDYDQGMGEAIMILGSFVNTATAWIKILGKLRRLVPYDFDAFLMTATLELSNATDAGNNPRRSLGIILSETNTTVAKLFLDWSDLKSNARPFRGRFVTRTLQKRRT